MIKHYCDVSKEEVKFTDMYRISIFSVLDSKPAIASLDISPAIKEQIKTFILGLTVQE